MKILQDWLGLFLETACALCQRSTPGCLCQDCERQLLQCRLPQSRQMWPGQPGVFAWGEYGGSLKRALAALKYQNQPQLARPLGHWLGQAWLLAQSNQSRCQTVVVPIPLHATKQHQRGYNQAELIARAFCQFTGFSLAAQGLLRTRSTEAQFGLSSQERERNLIQAFQIGDLTHPSPSVLLLDDIYTTGATARSAVTTCHRAGFRVGGIVAVARAIQVKGDEPGAAREVAPRSQKSGLDPNR